MKPRITLITIGVDNLERSLTFYRDGLGFPTRDIVGTEFEHGAVAFFDLMNGLKLAIWGRKDMAYEAKVPLGPRSATEFSLGHNVRSKTEVETSSIRHGGQERSSLIRPMMPFGADTPRPFKIPMDIFGKSPGIRRWNRPTRL
jgi:catechol 2,3-dioxygenase-like lactoylglutathione lyase family enzyme